MSIFFAEILHAGRKPINMKHIKQDFSLKAWVRAPGVDFGGGVEAKIKLFQNMVMLHIKLKLTTFSATWDGVKPYIFVKVVMLNIKLKGI